MEVMPSSVYQSETETIFAYLKGAHITVGNFSEDCSLSKTEHLLDASVQASK